jgi:tetratricopeptide (TPR) repeat protein
MADLSDSQKARDEGNLYYVKAKTVSDTSEKSKLLKHAIKCYQEATKLADNDIDKSSAWKNLGATYQLLAPLDDASKVYKNALASFNEASKHGRLCRETKWIDQLEKSLKSCMTCALASVQVGDVDFAITEIGIYKNIVPLESIQHLCEERISALQREQAISECGDEDCAKVTSEITLEGATHKSYNGSSKVNND